MLPEEKIACRFSKQRKLSPPVDTESLVKEFAVLEEDSLPEGYDAVYLDKSEKHLKPRVIITNNISRTRRVFTLGHELGHILIPWHIGTHFCRVDAEARLVDHLVRSVESQANRFAAELLMPVAWVEKHLKTTKTLKELVSSVKEANVSYQAASIRLLQVLPLGYAFLETDPSGKIIRSQATAGTQIKLPSENEILNTNSLDNLAEDFAKFESGNSTILWWRLSHKLEAPKTDSPAL
jgi:Zn-dependent peptidase ImmA (M78 family)